MKDMVSPPEVMTWQQEDTTKCQAKAPVTKPCKFDHLVNVDGVRFESPDEKNMTFTAYQQQKGFELRHVLVLKAKALTSIRLLKEYEGHRRMAEEKVPGLEKDEGAWTVDQPLAGNICGEDQPDDECAQDAKGTSCGEGLTANKFGECEYGSFFMLLGFISMIILS